MWTIMSEKLLEAIVLAVVGYVLWVYTLKWFALEMNKDHSVIFELVPKYCILDSCSVFDIIDIVYQIKFQTMKNGHQQAFTSGGRLKIHLNNIYPAWEPPGREPSGSVLL